MLIHLAQILSGRTSVESISSTLEIPADILKDYSVEVTEPLDVRGEISMDIQDEVRVNLLYRVGFVFNCARCLIPVKKSIENTLEKVIYLKRSGEDYDDDKAYVEGYSLNVGDMVIEDLVLNMPNGVICNVDCKGLCASCGANLNETECSCDNEDIDPRLLELKKFFTEG